MSQSQVYLFLYEEFCIWKWIAGIHTIFLWQNSFVDIFIQFFSIAGQRGRYHAGVSLYGKEYCYTKDGILALTHVYFINVNC